MRANERRSLANRSKAGNGPSVRVDSLPKRDHGNLSGALNAYILAKTP
jgi:hypothetical protein